MSNVGLFNLIFNYRLEVANPYRVLWKIFSICLLCTSQFINWRYISLVKGAILLLALCRMSGYILNNFDVGLHVQDFFLSHGNDVNDVNGKLHNFILPWSRLNRLVCVNKQATIGAG